MLFLSITHSVIAVTIGLLSFPSVAENNAAKPSFAVDTVNAPWLNQSGVCEALVKELNAVPVDQHKNLTCALPPLTQNSGITAIYWEPIAPTNVLPMIEQWESNGILPKKNLLRVNYEKDNLKLYQALIDIDNDRHTEQVYMYKYHSDECIPLIKGTNLAERKGKTAAFLDELTHEKRWHYINSFAPISRFLIIDKNRKSLKKSRLGSSSIFAYINESYSFDSSMRYAINSSPEGEANINFSGSLNKLHFFKGVVSYLEVCRIGYIKD